MALPIPVKATLRFLRGFYELLDVYANEVTYGPTGRPLSYRFALWQRAGRRSGCILCRLLDLFEIDHCEIVRQRYDGPGS